jgi:LmbE family N-acetylglucosaminyl deacetylase
VRDVLSFAVNSSSEWAFSSFAPVFQPSIFVDISATLDRKLDALRCYKGELRDAPHPRSIDAVRAVAVATGATVGVGAAEAFHAVRVLR